jgi:hypothetical protein
MICAHAAWSRSRYFNTRARNARVLFHESSSASVPEMNAAHQSADQSFDITAEMRPCC